MAAAQTRTFLGHPVGLFVLFFTEMWERFSYYGMRVLLVLYMAKALLIRISEGQQVWGYEYIEALYGNLGFQAMASQIYGLYTFLVYCTPLLGGWIADRYIGRYRSVVIGGILMTIGHFLMAIESFFFIALVFIILGNGFFKPNISTQVGSLYPEGDPRKDSAFTIFYMGINLGALMSPFVCGTLGEVYGWHYGFTAAGVGMVVGLMVYLWGQKYLVLDEKSAEEQAAVSQEPLTSNQIKAILGFLVLSLTNIVFWGVYEQQGNTLQLFSSDHTDWTVGSWTMPSTWLQSFNPLFIFTFAPLLMMLWKKQGNRQLSSIAKMSLGCFLLGGSFAVLYYVNLGFDGQTKMSFLWFIPLTMILTLGELFFSPIGLSVVTKVAPARYAGLMMGWWFLTSGMGNYFSGYLGTYYSQMVLSDFFALMIILGISVGVFLFVLQKPLKKAVGSGV